MMAFLAADGAVLPVKEYALADMDLHVTFCRSARLACTVAERALRVGDFDDSLACTHGTVFRLHHMRYSITSVI
jgi:hypothetical protein